MKMQIMDNIYLAVRTSFYKAASCIYIHLTNYLIDQFQCKNFEFKKPREASANSREG